MRDILTGFHASFGHPSSELFADLRRLRRALRPAQ
jgi:hypothetical protein